MCNREFCAGDVGAAGSVIGACWGDLGDPEYKVARQTLRHCHDHEEEEDHRHDYCQTQLEADGGGEVDYHRIQLKGVEAFEYVTPIYFPLQSSFFEEALRVFFSSNV